jgi:FKBP-type peptidyl-prolyl cis-trans isomerase FkpA
MKLVKNLSGILAVAVMMVTVSCNNVDFRKTSAGVPYKIFKSSSGDSVRENYIVKIHVVRRTKDTLLYNSYNQKMAEYVEVRRPEGKLSYEDLGGNVMEILLKAKKGDSIFLTQSTDSLLKNPQISRGLKPGQQATTGIKIDDVFKSKEEADVAFAKDNAPMMKEAEERAAKAKKESLANFKKDTAAQAQMSRDSKIIENYLKAHNIQAEKTEWGVYIQTLTPGSGPRPQFGKFANVKYKGMLLSGESFDEGVYPVQIGRGGTVPGFEEGVSLLQKGQKARIFIPSLLGYGPQGSPPKIKPNENLMFELELLSITDTQPQQEAPPAGH